MWDSLRKLSPRLGTTHIHGHLANGTRQRPLDLSQGPSPSTLAISFNDTVHDHPLVICYLPPSRVEKKDLNIINNKVEVSFYLF